MSQHVDVVVVGAGLSGIGAGYRLRTECPDKSFEILEARGALGGTWDQFRYPGIRSDSDMFTLGYPFKPWLAAKAIADGPAILDYLRETAVEFGIDKHIRYHTRVVGADWSSADARWTLTLDDAGTRRTMTCGFLYACAGYYDYERGHDPGFTGVDDFAGDLVHPQFWPADLDHAGKRVVVIGSGATAATLVPALAATAAKVTMLQRSPTWMVPTPSVDRIAETLRKVLPSHLAHRVLRLKNVLFTLGFYQLCKRRPALARRLLTRIVTNGVKDPAVVAEHFTPRYDPWDQRPCVLPDSDLFHALTAGTADVVTDTIDTFVPDGVRLTSGRVLPADIVVSATGLRLLVFGGIAPSVDGEPVALPEQFVWRGTMLTGLPNFAVCVGYTNASWTLRADLTSRLVCKVLNWMDERGHAAVVPRPETALTASPLLDLASGYIQRSIADFPRQGHRAPWRVRQNYLIDAATTLRTDLDATLRADQRV